MSATVVGDPSPTPIAPAAAAAAEVEVSAACDCCGLTEDCTPAYIAVVRARYGGRWVCGLCAEAVEDEIRRGPVGADEAVRRHAALRRSFRSSNAGEHLIAAVRRLLRRRSLDFARGPLSAPSSPARKKMPGDCLPALAG